MARPTTRVQLPDIVALVVDSTNAHRRCSNCLPSRFPATPNRGKVGAMPDAPAHPRPDMRPAWRAACLAYRKVRATGQLDHPAHLAARAAVLEVLPSPTEKEASQEAINAIAYATSFHSAWFWAPLKGA